MSTSTGLGTKIGIGAVALVLIALIGLPMRAFVVDFYDTFWNNPFNDEEFDQAIWLAHADDPNLDNSRGRMAYAVRDMLAEQRPSQSAVIEMLGAPDTVSQDSTSISYWLGFWHGARSKMVTMDIAFEDSVLSSVAMVRR